MCSFCQRKCKNLWCTRRKVNKSLLLLNLEEVFDLNFTNEGEIMFVYDGLRRVLVKLCVTIRESTREVHAGLCRATSWSASVARHQRWFFPISVASPDLALSRPAPKRQLKLFRKLSVLWVSKVKKIISNSVNVLILM